jgi:hypothetical protein
VRSPYKGLLPYTEEDRPYFFGRDGDREIVAANLKASRLTVLYGASGVGKSSLLRAGVLHDINAEAARAVARRRQPEFVAVYCQDWRDDPAGNVAAALRHAWVQVALQPPAAPERPGLGALLESHAAELKAAVLLILDQFEEYLFYQGTRAADESVDRELAEILADRAQKVHILISQREDALAKLDQFKGRIHSLFDNYLRIDHLDANAARDAIRLPVETFCKLEGVGPIAIEPSLVEAVVDQVRAGKLSFREGVETPAGPSTSDRIETPYLQLVMSRIWDDESGGGARVPASLRRVTLERLGESASIVKNHLDLTMSAFSDEEREVAERIFFYLVTPSGTKIAHTVSDLASFAGLDEARVEKVVTKLAGHDHRILRAAPALDPSTGVTRYEIYHDALAEAILDWQQRFRAGQKQRQLEAELVEHERQERERRAREQEIERGKRQRRALAASLVAALLGLGLAATALWYAREAGQARRRADRNLAFAIQQSQVALMQAAIAAQSLHIRQAVLAGDQRQLKGLLGSLRQDGSIKFRVTDEDLAYRNPAGQEIFRFCLFPDKSSLPQGKDAIAFITYLADNPTFQNRLMTTGINTDFAATYIGWGCLGEITAFVEYADPKHQPTVTQFDGCPSADAADATRLPAGTGGVLECPPAGSPARRNP